MAILYGPTGSCPSAKSDTDSAFENFDSRAAAARHEFLPRLRDFHFDLAGPAHLDALLYVQSLRRGQLAMLYQIGGQRTGGGTGGGVFVDFPRKHATREGFVRATELEAIRHGAIFTFEAAQIMDVHIDAAQRGAIAEGNHQV